MTGKGCVHTDAIDRTIASRQRPEQPTWAGFTAIPFRPNIGTFYNLCLRRFMQSAYAPIQLVTADQVRRTGYVICEKICKKIQDSDFVVVDVSSPNANVFYELGLAYGVDQKILVVYHADSRVGRQTVQHLGCEGQAYAYRNLAPLSLDGLDLSQRIWRRSGTRTDRSAAQPLTLLLDELPRVDAGAVPPVGDNPAAGPADGDEVFELGADGPGRWLLRRRRPGAVDALFDISLDFATHVEAAVGVAIDNILETIQRNPHGPLGNYVDLIDKLKTAQAIKGNDSFAEIRARVEQAFCCIIRTGGAYRNPMAYFWLGYCHALGKNVIPISVVDHEKDDVTDLAFDIRALWHMTFARENPGRLGSELEEVLHQMIVADFTEWSRRRFWDAILGRRGKVSVFTGALHSDPIGREMVGDWDLRAASELTSYFAGHQYRATIESPVYQPEQVTQLAAEEPSEPRGRQPRVSKERYVAELQAILRDKNCVIIASPDVNPLTEIVLGKVYGLPEAEWFAETDNAQTNPYAVIAVKEKEGDGVPGTRPPSRAYYRERACDAGPPVRGSRGRGKGGAQPVAAGAQRGAAGAPEDSAGGVATPGRGFESYAFGQSLKLMGQFASQTEAERTFTVHAHILIARNPFRSEPSDGEAFRAPKFLVVLNGVSGPATFALTHALTGGVSREFVAYDGTGERPFDPEAESERLLQTIVTDIEKDGAEPDFFRQYILEVTVGPPRKSDAEPDPARRIRQRLFDWRHILRWGRVWPVTQPPPRPQGL